MWVVQGTQTFLESSSGTSLTTMTREWMEVPALLNQAMVFQHITSINLTRQPGLLVVGYAMKASRESDLARSGILNFVPKVWLWTAWVKGSCCIQVVNGSCKFLDERHHHSTLQCLIFFVHKIRTPSKMILTCCKICCGIGSWQTIGGHTCEEDMPGPAA